MMDKKKLATSLIAIILTMGVVIALWIFGPATTGFSIYKISSQKPNLTISQQLLGGDFDVTNSSMNFSDVLIIDSSVNEKAIIGLQTIKEDFPDDDCTDFENDCNISFYLGEGLGFGYGFGDLQEVFDGNEIQLTKGENKFSVFGTCQQYSCNQNITAVITLSLKQKQ